MTSSSKIALSSSLLVSYICNNADPPHAVWCSRLNLARDSFLTAANALKDTEYATGHRQGSAFK
jgi:hypothetical protein